MRSIPFDVYVDQLLSIWSQMVSSIGLSPLIQVDGPRRLEAFRDRLTAEWRAQESTSAAEAMGKMLDATAEWEESGAPSVHACVLTTLACAKWWEDVIGPHAMASIMKRFLEDNSWWIHMSEFALVSKAGGIHRAGRVLAEAMAEAESGDE